MVREADISDFLELCEICAEDLGYSCEPELIKSSLENIDKNRERVFVATVDDKAVGFVHIEKYRTLYFSDMANILGLAIAKEYQKKGYGRALMRTAEQWAKEMGINVVRLNSGISRNDAHIFYRMLGYSNEKEQIRFLKYL